MKKILMAIALITCLIFPLSAMAMTAIDENDLSTVTGQAGVSINLDVNMGLSVDTIAWGDKDGLGATSIGSGAGWIGLKSLDATGIRIRLRTDLLAADWTTFNAVEPGIIGPVVGPVGTAMTALGALPAPLAAELSANFSIANIHTYTNQNVGVYLVYAAMVVAGGPGLPGGLSSNFNIQNPATWTAGDFALLGALDASGMITAGFNLNVAAMTLTGTLAAANAGDGIAPLTIDVATDTTTGHGVANTTFVRIGTGSLEIQMATLGADVKLGTGTTPALNQELGSIYLGNLDVKVNGTSYVDIYDGRTGNLQGVTLGFSVTVDSLKLGTLSWTDRDGFVNGIIGTAGSVATTGFGTTPSGQNNTPYSNTLLSGSVGLINTDIETLTVAGALTIDVATDTTTGHGGVVNTTFVHLGFANTKIGMATLDTTAVLGPEKTLTTEVQTLGSIYMGGLAATVSGYADIYAHAGSGVSIDFNAAVGVNMDAISWGDINGVGSTTTAGYVGLKSLAISGLGLSGNATIDVATVMSGDTASSIPLGTTFVQIGVNHLSVNLTSMTADVVMAGDKTLTTNSQTLGSLYMGGMNTNLNGTVDIYSPKQGATANDTNTTGVVIALNLLPTNIHIDAISWGDADGFGTTTNPGYVGLKTLDITGLTVAGKVSIDVATIDGSVLPTSLITLMYAGYPTHHLGYYNSPLDYASTFVHIGLGTGNGFDDAASSTGALAIHLASMATDVGLANAPNLATAANFGTLGSIYIGNLTAKVNGWVDIAAH